MVRGVLALAAVAVFAFRGDPLPPSDSTPVWSPDASAIVFVRSDGRRAPSLRVMESRGTGERELPTPVGVLSPDWRWLAYTEYAAQAPPKILVSTPEGQLRRIVVEGSNPVWAPSGEQLAFTPPLGMNEPASIDVVNLDGGGRRTLAERAQIPAWSPDGTRIAFRDLSTPFASIAVVDADGSNRRSLGIRGDAFAWSPDGTALALVLHHATRELGVHAGATLALVRVRDRRVRRYWIPEYSSSVAWSPDAKHIALDGVFRFDVARGKSVRLARFGFTPRFSPDGRRVAFSAGGSCGDRSGIFVVGTEGSRPARLTNDCRVLGGPGADNLRGSEYSDVLLGLGGDDSLTAVDDFYYEGDELDGGPGDDRLAGGGGTDVLVGGPGRDVMDGGGAADVLYAADGEPDVVACGTTRGHDVERDRAYVDKRDVVRDDCEYVFRRGVRAQLPKTFFTISVWPTGRDGASRRRTLLCSPPRGTLRRPADACAKLAFRGDPFEPVRPETDCPTRAAERPVARVVGRFRGRYVTAWFARADGCEIARWERFAFLFVS